MLDLSDPAVTALNRYITTPADNEVFYDSDHLNRLVSLAHGPLRDVLFVSPGTVIYRGISTYEDTFAQDLAYFTDGDPSSCGVSFVHKRIEHAGSWDALASSWSLSFAVAKTFAEDTEGKILLRAEAPYASFGGKGMAKALARTGKALAEQEVIVVGPVTITGVAWCPPDEWGSPWDATANRLRQKTNPAPATDLIRRLKF